MLTARDPLTQQMTDVSMTSFADDIAKAKHVKNVSDLNRKLKKNNCDVDTAFAKKKMAQNTGKQEILPRFYGRGAEKEMRKEGQCCCWGRSLADYGAMIIRTLNLKSNC